MDAQAPRGDLFPEITPFEQGMLGLDDLHTMYWEQSGRPDGIPVVFLHGGPGAGTVAAHRRFFDPEHYRIVIFDQRGAGRSTPAAELRDNTTAHLIEESAGAALLRGESATLLRWLQALPDDMVRSRPLLSVFHAAALLLSSHPLAAVESRLQDAAQADPGSQISLGPLGIGARSSPPGPGPLSLGASMDIVGRTMGWLVYRPVGCRYRSSRPKQDIGSHLGRGRLRPSTGLRAIRRRCSPWDGVRGRAHRGRSGCPRSR